ncbi:MAG: lytic transglycosylase domain-containing protein [Hydrogenothermaceae bacterium]|nr:lytic transglycosylase domain-containing protein [Hydrogenothermaceae bacterium]
MKLIFIITFIFFSLSYGSTYKEALYILNLDFLEQFNEDKVTKVIEDNKSYAISSYIALKTASFLIYRDIDKAEKFLKMVDEKALLKEDKPFYLYLKSIIEKDRDSEVYKNVIKNLVKSYPESYYAYKVYIENISLFSEDEKVEFIESLIKRRYKERAMFLFFSLSDEDAIKYVRLLMVTTGSEKESIFSQISENSPYYIKALKFMANIDKNYEKTLLDKLRESDFQEYQKYVAKFLEKAFYRDEDISYYLSLVDEKSFYFSKAKWIEFLFYYKSGDYSKSLDILNKYGNLYDEDKTNYWQWLINTKLSNYEKAKFYLHKIKDREIKDIKEISFYRAMVDYKTGNLYRFKIEPLNVKNYEVLDNLKTLKTLDYKLAYTEAVYLIKLGYCNEVYNIMPEVGVKCFDKNSVYTFVKPFGKIDYNENLVYSIIRQESFFDPYVISSSNAVGITQFIPKTAYWFAKNMNIENFDIIHLFSPELAIKFSVEYLKYLDKLWKSNEVYMIASYNSGENAVKNFLEKNKITDIAEFIELYPYEETRDYVKKVLRNYIIYKSME